MKKVLYFVAAIGILYLILALAGPSIVKVERSVTINKPADKFKTILLDLKFFQEKWSPWTEKDPNMKVSFSGTPGVNGHKMEWSGNDQVMSGTMELADVSGDSILIDVVFGKGGGGKSHYITKTYGDTTNFTWGLVMHIPFFARPMILFMNMEKKMAPDFEKGVANLKKVVEEMKDGATSANYEVKELEWSETNFVGSKKETVGFRDIPAFFGKNFGSIMQELGKNKIEPAGAPTGIIWGYDEAKGSMDLSAVIKVAKGVKVKGYENYIFPASKVLHVAYFGDYEKTKDGHMALEAYMKEKGLSQAAMLEEYANDPGVEKDTAKWLTNIYYIIK